MPEVESFELPEESRYEIKCSTTWMGKDLVVHLYGGDQPHVGAVAIAFPRPSLMDSNSVSATASVFTVIGHKDDEIARSIALYLATNILCTVVVVAGVHIDEATKTDIDYVKKNTMEMADLIVKRYVDQVNTKGN